MTRNLLLATTIVAAMGWATASGTAAAGYVLSGLKDYANAPPISLTAKDCRAVYDGQVRLVSEEAFRKYLARHPEFDKNAGPRRHNIGNSGIAPRSRSSVLRSWSGDCK